MSFDAFKEWLKPTAEKLENILKFGRYTKATGQNGQLQQIQVKTLRNIEDAFKMGQFGFNSKAPIDSRIVLAKIGNDKVIIANEHLASIIDISSGNSIIYNQDGNYVKIENNTITCKATNIINNCSNYTINADSKFIVNTPISEFSDVVNVLGKFSALSYSGLNGSSMTTNVNLETTADVKASGISLNSHVHNGVQAGSDTSGGPQ